MAGPVYVKIRYYNPPKDCIINDTSNVLQLDRYYKDGKKRPFFEILWVGASQADEELGTTANSVKDGTTTPFQITVVSAQANDTDAGTGDARKVALIGVTVGSGGIYYALGSSHKDYETPKLTVEVVNLNGTTDVLTQRYYLRLIHAYVCDWGSGGADAKGDITIESPADTDLQTITATYNESNGCVLFFPKDYSVKLDMVRIHPQDNSVAAADGIMLQLDEYAFENTLYTDPDIPTDSYVAFAPNNVDIDRDAWPLYRLTTLQSKLTFTELLIANSQTYKIHCTMLVKHVK